MEGPDSEMEKQNSNPKVVMNDIVDGMVATLLYNIAYAYASIFYFEEAVKCLDFVLNRHTLLPEALARRAYVVSLNAGALACELESALHDAEHALRGIHDLENT